MAISAQVERQALSALSSATPKLNVDQEIDPHHSQEKSRMSKTPFQPPASKRAVLAACAAMVTALAMTPVQAQFRINPYLQNPSSESMSFTWFTEQAGAGTLKVFEAGSNQALFTATSTPALQSVLAYTQAEKNQVIGGLVQGSWLRSDDNWKHGVDVTGLTPGTQYRYTVEQNGSVFESTFRSAPSKQAWNSVRFVAMSDSETEPLGQVNRREWTPGALAPGSLARPDANSSAWASKFGSRTLSGVRVLNYALTEDEGYRRNLQAVASRDIDFLMMPGDLVQGGGYQPGWDSFFRHNAGDIGSGLSRHALLPALGNWENFGALNGGYGTDADGRFGPKFGRDKYHTYFDAPSNGTPAHRDNYYRVDYGPVTVITLDSSNGEPDDRPQNYVQKATGQQYNGPGTDTQNNFNRAAYEAAGGTDLADFNPGSPQWQWAQEQLAQARANGQIVFVQFHHAPYSNGEHGLPMDHVLTSGQGGTPMRQYQAMFERYGVAAVLSGHSEMFERSWVDGDNDGVGVTYYDVGVAGDGLRGERRNGNSLNDPLLKYNPFSQWTADQDAAERWELVDGVPQLVAGGKHYGHLEVNVVNLQDQDDGLYLAKITLTPVYLFPVLDSNYNLVRTERRVYSDEITLLVGRDGAVVAVPEPSSLALMALGAALLSARVRRRKA